jgi:hypothetical protein
MIGENTLWRSKPSLSPHGFNVCELEYVIIVEESNSIE